jgi:anti-sigma factor RsiW
MKCEVCREYLPAYVVGDKDLEQRPDIEEHLAGCAECQEELQRLQGILQAFGDDARSEELSEVELLRLEKAVYRNLAAGASARKPVSRRSVGILLRVAAGLALFLIGYMSHSLLTESESQRTIVPGTQVNVSFASIDRAQYEGMRFSAAGLKAIAQGRKTAVEQLDKMLERRTTKR